MFIFSAMPAGQDRVLDFPAWCQADISRIIAPIYDATKTGPRWAEISKSDQEKIISQCYEYKKNRVTAWKIFLTVDFNKLYDTVLSWEIKDFLENVLDTHFIRRDQPRKTSMPEELVDGDPILDFAGFETETMLKVFIQWFRYFKDYQEDGHVWDECLSPDERQAIIEDFNHKISGVLRANELARARTEGERLLNDMLLRKVVTDFFNGLSIFSLA